MAVSVETLPEGVLIVGRYVGIEGDAFPRLLIDCEIPGRSRPVRRQVDFSGFSRGTGVPTDVGTVVQDLRAGQLIAVRVFTDAKEFTYKKDNPERGNVAGDKGLMVVFSASAVVALDD